MAAQYTEITLEDMDRFMKRAFRALRPKRDDDKGEYVYTLKLSKNVAIRVYSSIMKSGVGAGVGADAIRIQLYGTRVRHPLVKGKSPIVKRTQGWRNSLQKQIELAMEKYDENEGYWEERGGGPSPEEKTKSREKEGKPTLKWGPLKIKPLIIQILEEVGGPDDTISIFRDREDLGTTVILVKDSVDPRSLVKRLGAAFNAKGVKPIGVRGKVVTLRTEDVLGEEGAASPLQPPTDKQVRYCLRLLKRMGEDDWRDAVGVDWPKKYKSGYPPDERHLQTLGKWGVSSLIDDLMKNGYGFSRYADGSFAPGDLEDAELDQSV